MPSIYAASLGSVDTAESFQTVIEENLYLAYRVPRQMANEWPVFEVL